MGVNGKRKGNAFERDIANLFSDHFVDTFKRVPMSGALVGGCNRTVVEKGLRSDAVEILAGDIITPENFPFSLECKSYKDFEFHQAIKGKNKVLDGWIAQAEDDAMVSNKIMLLIMKFVRKGEYICSYDLDMENGDKISSHLKDYMFYREKYLIYTLESFLELTSTISVIDKWNINKKVKGE